MRGGAGRRGAGGEAGRITWGVSGEGSWRPNLRFEPTGLPSVGLRLKRESLGGREPRKERKNVQCSILTT